MQGANFWVQFAVDVLILAFLHHHIMFLECCQGMCEGATSPKINYQWLSPCFWSQPKINVLLFITRTKSWFVSRASVKGTLLLMFSSWHFFNIRSYSCRKFERGTFSDSITNDLVYDSESHLRLMISSKHFFTTRSYSWSVARVSVKEALLQNQ